MNAAGASHDVNGFTRAGELRDHVAGIEGLGAGVVRKDAAPRKAQHGMALLERVVIVLDNARALAPIDVALGIDNRTLARKPGFSRLYLKLQLGDFAVAGGRIGFRLEEPAPVLERVAGRSSEGLLGGAEVGDRNLQFALQSSKGAVAMS